MNKKSIPFLKNIAERLSISSKQGNVAQKDITLKRPYFIGHELYELHTDANLFTTRVMVNGQEIKLSNAEGNGSITNNLYSVTGATGYPNKTYLNGYLQPGENEVKIIFHSPLYDKIKGSRGEQAFVSDMYAHVVINSGQLTEGSLGTKSYYLDQFIASPNKDANLLKNTLLRRFSSDDINTEISVTHSITIPKKNAIQVSKDDCEVELIPFSNYKGKILLNGVVVYKKEHFNEGTFLANLDDQIVVGMNTLSVEVNALENDEATIIGLQQLYDLSRAIETSNLPLAFKGYGFGQTFNNAIRPLVNIAVDKPGNYSTSFNVK